MGAMAIIEAADNLAQNRPSGLEYEAISVASVPALAELRLSDQKASFHDSTGNRESRIYGEDNRYTYSVKQYMDELKASPGFQAFDFDYDSGVTLVKRVR